jgi:RNA polymerase sigma-70 factor (ECF subfamily)
MEVWQEIKKEKEKGARRLVAEYGNRIYAAALLLSSNDLDAEELAFKTLDQAVKKIHLFNPEKVFFTWLYAILLNFYRMELRKKRLQVIPMGATSELPEVACDSFGAALGEAGDEDVAEAVRSLPSHLRETVVLRYYSEKSVDEISEIMGVPAGTIKSRLHHARKILNELLTKKGGRYE